MFSWNFGSFSCLLQRKVCLALITLLILFTFTITFVSTSASLENKLLLEPKPCCRCCSWLDPEYLQSVTALFPQGSVPCESYFSHVVLFKSSHFVKLEYHTWFEHYDKSAKPPKYLSNPFLVETNSIFAISGKNKISCFIASLHTNNTLSKSIRTVNIFHKVQDHTLIRRTFFLNNKA